MIRLAVVLLSALSLAAATTDSTYTALRAARPDGRSVPLAKYAFDRDVYHITLDGSLNLLAQVNGETPGAVFVGSGEYALTPAQESEPRQLVINTGDDQLEILKDTFESAVIFDGALFTAVEANAKAGTPNNDATRAFDDFLNRERRDFATNFHIRILQDMLDPQPQPLFLMFVRGKKYGPSILAVDPRGADALHLFDISDAGEKTLLFNADKTKGGIWYLAHLRSEYASGTAAVMPRPAEASRYLIDTTIAPNNEISGSTSIAYMSTLGGRVLPLALTSNVRIDDVQFSPAVSEPSFTSVPFIQERSDEDGDAAIVFPRALESQSAYVLKITYHGIGKEVLRESGDGNFTVGARESWYPNLGAFRSPANFELTFRTPQKSKNQIVAVGTEVSNKIEGEQRVAVWKSTHPLRVAGFNYGNFKKMVQTDNQSGMTVEVYTNPGEPDIIRQINQALMSGAGQEDGFSPFTGGVRVDTAQLAQAAFADGANTARAGDAFFGALPDKRIAITQQSAWFYGQSWPTLVYLPYLAFVNSTTRNMLGFGLDTAHFVDEVGSHEVAHQWWGHEVGWKSYHDAWLSEGFAEFTAGIVLHLRKGAPGYNEFLERKRRAILEKPRGASIANSAAGPISQGLRLSTWQDPQAYSAIVYEKGAYVLHMLRMLMMDPSNPNPDFEFQAMMHDFHTTWAGRNPSTADFQHVVEKHANRKMKITRDESMNWFFNQWVNGTYIPRLVSKLEAKRSADGKYHISGTITQSEVTDDFASIVPIYVNFEKGSFAKMGDVVVVGNSTKTIEADLALPKEPRGITINLMHDVLTR